LTAFKLTNIYIYQIGKPGILGNSGNIGPGQKLPNENGGAQHEAKGTDMSANKNGIFSFINFRFRR